jgi:hypothetical protein
MSGSKKCADCKTDKPLSDFPGGRPHSYCKACNNARNRESVKRLYGGSRHYHLKQRFGIGAADVTRLIELQGGVCALCGNRPATQVDHDHRSGKVRAILCLHCNAGLGAFGDDPEVVARAIRYLEKNRV